MARGSQQQDDLLMGDDITAAFLSEDDAPADDQPVDEQPTPDAEEWDEEPVAGQLAVDVYETKEKLVVKGRVAGVNKSELDVSISDNTAQATKREWKITFYRNVTGANLAAASFSLCQLKKMRLKPYSKTVS
jgi:HSP20 family molecular chaperone IbpA